MIAEALFEGAGRPSYRKQSLTGGGANIEMQRVADNIFSYPDFSIT